MKNSKLFIVMISLFSFQLASAVMPVVDPAEIAKTVDVIKRLNKQYQSLKMQYQQMQKQYQAVTGNYGWGNYKNTLSELVQKREWSPKNWESALKGMAGGNPARYHELLKQYEQDHLAISKNNYEKGRDKNLAKSYQQQVQTNQTSATQASYEFNEINKHLKTLYHLGQSIENAQSNNNLKAAVDLNSRIQLEIGYISVSELRMQALLNEQTATSQAKKITQETEASQFNQAGE